jgi:hypothetical protein
LVLRANDLAAATLLFTGESPVVCLCGTFAVTSMNIRKKTSSPGTFQAAALEKAAISYSRAALAFVYLPGVFGFFQYQSLF